MLFKKREESSHAMIKRCTVPTTQEVVLKYIYLEVSTKKTQDQLGREN